MGIDYRKTSFFKIKLYILGLGLLVLQCGDSHMIVECEQGLSNCDNRCVDLMSDPSNCGRCGRRCDSSQVCSNGECSLECSEGLSNCDNRCVDLRSDPNNCGRCGNRCPSALNAHPICVGGECSLECNAGWVDNDNNPGCESPCEHQGVETCNGLDDDCDGRADEDFECSPGRTSSCTTNCGSLGTKICSSSCTWGPCNPPTETCNGLDDDCDGRGDEDFECVLGSISTCITNCGTIGTTTCSSSCRWSLCNPPTETCNGLDDDCDGFCDDGFGCCRGTIEACVTSCGTIGQRVCSDSCNLTSCIPPEELCDPIDQDCDGLPYGARSPFNDLPESDGCFPYAMAMYSLNIMQGYGDGGFHPNDYATRAMAAVAIARAFSLSPTNPPSAFCDINDVSWAASAIQALYEAGITTGKPGNCLVGTTCPGTHFCPNDPMTRAEMAVFLYRALHHMTSCPSCPASPYFCDSSSNWACGCIEALYTEGIVVGRGYGGSCLNQNSCSQGVPYCPEDYATRCELAIVLTKALSAPMPCKP